MEYKLLTVYNVSVKITDFCKYASMNLNHVNSRSIIISCDIQMSYSTITSCDMKLAYIHKYISFNF